MGEYIEKDGNWIRRERSADGPANLLASIPVEIQELENLETLILGGDWASGERPTVWQIRNIDNLGGLKKLKVLNLSNNKITDVSVIAKLESLEELYLNNNQISHFPEITHTQLKNLKDLYLSNNQIQDLKFLQENSSLESLDLHSNEILDLRPIKLLLEKLDIDDIAWGVKMISLGQNPLEVPPKEVVARGSKDVLSYIERYELEQENGFQGQTSSQPKRLKLILVGNSHVGKSTLANWLIDGEVKETVESTHGIIVKEWKAVHQGSEFLVKIFDFGGQEYYHETHHLFFSQRTTYILLWDREHNSWEEKEILQNRGGKQGDVLEKTQLFPLTYWLSSIQFYLKRKRPKVLNSDIDLSEPKPSKSILVVQNKVDQGLDQAFINNKGISTQYPEVYDFASISLNKDRGLSHLKDILFELFRLNNIVQESNLYSWSILQDKITANKNLSTMRLSDFKTFCNDILKKRIKKEKKDLEQLLFDDDQIRAFAKYLNDLGIALYYSWTEALSDRIFFNQEEILDTIYKILKDTANQKGEFSDEYIKQILSTDSEIEYEIIVELMTSFKLIFKLPQNNNQGQVYVAPMYLPKAPQQSVQMFIDASKAPNIRYLYDKFIHKNIILDIFSFYGEKIKDASSSNDYYYWREGLILKNPFGNELVMIKFVPSEKKGVSPYIDVYAMKGNTSQSFFLEVVEKLDEINDGRAKKCVTSNGIDFIPLKKVLEMEDKGYWNFLYEEKLFSLLNFKQYLKIPPMAKKIFISYSKEDVSYVLKFKDHLASLKLNGLVTDWFCTELTAGKKWDKEIQDHFAEADIICFMVSPNFMRTNYIHKYEIDKAFQRYEENGSLMIVPIILDFCNWRTKSNNLADFTALPYTAKPINDFINPNMAWYVVIESLRLMIEKGLDPRKEKETFYEHSELPLDIKNIFERIATKKVDRNSIT